MEDRRLVKDVLKLMIQNDISIDDILTEKERQKQEEQ